jgi:carbamoyl-phosphate synthase large subunit
VSAKANHPEPNAEQFNILFTCVGRRVVLIRAFREALAELGLTGSLVGTDLTESAAGMQAVDCPELVPSARTLHYGPRLKELVAKHKIRLLIPLTDLDLRILSRHAQEFQELGCTVMIAPEETVTVCRDKLKFDQLARRAGIKGIASRDLKAFQANPSYPCFVKPVHGSAAVGSGRVTNEREMRAHIGTYGNQLLVQEYVPGQEFTIDVFRRRDGVICAVVPRQRLSIRAGEVERSLTVNDPELIRCTMKLVEQLPGVWGVINAQCRRPAGGEPRFFEVNLRFGGGVPLSMAAGVPLPKFVLMEVLGQTVQPIVGQFTDKLLMTRYDDAYFVPVKDPTTLPGYKEPTNK